MTDAQRMGRRAALKRMRAKRRAAGLCIQCAEPSPKFWRCVKCRSEANAVNWKARHGVAA